MKFETVIYDVPTSDLKQWALKTAIINSSHHAPELDYDS